MLKRFTLIVLPVLILVSLFSLSRNEISTLPSDNWEAKYEPDEQFMLQRSWPDASFDIEAYTAAIIEANGGVATRGLDAFPGEWLVEGPGNIGARINTIALDPDDDQIIYAGFARGGVWKTIDSGQNWVPIFDDQPFLAIGDIEIDPQNSNVVYVGTGDPNISGSPGIGNGVYKSTDGGQSWTHLGLTETRITSKVLVDPSDSDNIYVATMGLPFEPTLDRGLYKSTNGGQSWEQILFVSEQAGICDLMIDPQNPTTLFAAGWDRIRNNFESIISGPGSKIWKTTDGGDNWTVLDDGLPTEETGRIGLAMSGTDTDVIFAEYIGTNSQLYGIYKSLNGGQSWTQIPTDEYQNGLSPNALGGFGWYFAKIRVNPENDNDIFLLGVDLWRTLDGGQNWFRDTPPWWTYEVHADKHDLVFGDSESDFDYLLATDGGLYASLGNQNFADIENIPASQFYRVAYNPHATEFYYGGMQDNGTSGGNALAINEWPRIYGGDGFQAAFHSVNPDISLVETQNGSINITFNGGYSYDFAGVTNGSDDRRNWDMPYMISQHDPNTLYTGTYKAWKGEIITDIEAVFWDSISGSLTMDIIDNPRYHTISTLHESPLVPGLLYYGTTDGKLSRTADDGATWVTVSDDLPERYVTDVKASPSMEDRVYVTHSGYKWGEYIPRIHRSDDQGLTWEDISGDLPDLAINDVYIHPMHEDSVIFVATDGGVYGTVDAGMIWERVGNNMPSVPVFDLELNIAENTLFAGTFARSIMSYPLDSITFPVIDDTFTNVVNLPIPTQNELKIYPSPAVDIATVEIQHPEGSGAYDLVILDIAGRLVHQENGQITGSEKKEIDVRNLVSGQYFVKVKMRHIVRTGKFIKQ